MNRFLSAKVFFLSFMLVFSATISRAGCDGPLLGSQYDRPVDSGSIDQQMFNAAVLHFTNNARCKNRRRPLASTQAVLSAAVAHAEYMARERQYNHVMNVRGATNVTEWLRRQNTDFRISAENIDRHWVPILNGISYIPLGNCRFKYTATGQPIPKHTYRSLAQTVVDSWMASPSHRTNMLERRFDRMGAAFGLDRNTQLCGDLYISQVFAG